jgi:hypothetical protein
VGAGFTLPLVTGPVTAVSGLTGLDRLRYRLVTDRGYLKILDLNSKNYKNEEKIPKNTS